MHIHMSWCCFPAFRTLAKSNLGLEWHDLFPDVEKAIADKAISPADVSEILLKKKRDPTAALESLLEKLERTKSVSEIPVVKINMDEDQTSEVLDDPPSPDGAGSDELRSKTENSDEKLATASEPVTATDTTPS